MSSDRPSWQPQSCTLREPDISNHFTFPIQLIVDQHGSVPHHGTSTLSSTKLLSAHPARCDNRGWTWRGNCSTPDGPCPADFCRNAEVNRKSTSFLQIETRNTIIDDPRGKSFSPTGGDLPHQRPVDEPGLSFASFEINLCFVLLETRWTPQSA